MYFFTREVKIQSISCSVSVSMKVNAGGELSQHLGTNSKNWGQILLDMKPPLIILCNKLKLCVVQSTSI